MSESFTVVWCGAMRRQYLSPSLQPSTPAPEPETPPQPAPEARSWTNGDHLRPYDLPRLRLRSSLLAAPAQFTVRELAQAAQVSATRARSYLDEQIQAGTVQPVPHQARATVYQRV